jgi:hypothetical protein
MGFLRRVHEAGAVQPAAVAAAPSSTVQRIAGFIQASKGSTKSNASNGAHVTTHLPHEQDFGVQ